MKKWLIITVAAVLLVLYGAFAVFWYIGPGAGLQTTEPTAETEQTAAPTQTTAATLSEQTQPEETVPLETVMPPTYALTARHAFVYDCGSEELLYTLGDQEESIAPASLTKLLIAYVALMYLDTDTLITAGEETTWIDPASSVAHVKPGDTLSVEMLVEGMLLQSGNDAAYALAVAAGRTVAGDPQLSARKALDTFIEEVNRQAQALGLGDTYFVTPDGLDADGHRTTPADMLKIALLAMEEPALRHYAGLPSDTVIYENGEIFEWLNTNFLLHPGSPYLCPEACVMKTGYTSKAGACMIAAFYTGDRYLLIGIFGCPQYEDRFADALFLYEKFR